MWGQKDARVTDGRPQTGWVWLDQKPSFRERNLRLGDLFLYLLGRGCSWYLLAYVCAFAKFCTACVPLQKFPFTHILYKHPVWRICFETSCVSKYPAISTYFTTCALSNAFRIYCKNCYIEEAEEAEEEEEEAEEEESEEEEEEETKDEEIEEEEEEEEETKEKAEKEEEEETKEEETEEEEEAKVEEAAAEEEEAKEEEAEEEEEVRICMVVPSLIRPLLLYAWRLS